MSQKQELAEPTVEEAQALAKRWAAFHPYADAEKDADGRPRCGGCDGFGTTSAEPCECGSEAVDLDGGDAPTCADCGERLPDKCWECDGWGYEQGLPEPLTDAELERLLAWVQQRMDDHEARVRDARAEIDARRISKGMPPTVSPTASREAMVMAIAIELDLAPWEDKPALEPDDLATAHALCDLARAS